MISTKPAFDFNVLFLNVITSSGSYDHNNHLLWWLMFFPYCVSIVCSLVSIILDGGLRFPVFKLSKFPNCVLFIGLQLQFEFTDGFVIMHKKWYSLDEVPYCFSRSSIKCFGHMGSKISDFNQVWVRLLGWSQLSNPSDSPCLFSCKMIKQNQLENHLVLLCHFCEAPFLLMKHTVTWISWNWHSYIVVFIVRTPNPRNSKV